MPSWRDQASEKAQEQIDALVLLSLEFANQMLAEHGEFYPFAAQIDRQGVQGFVAQYPADGGDQPESADVYDACVEALRHLAPSMQACAISADVRTSIGDAIKVDVEHEAGHAITVILPYFKSPTGKGATYDHIRTEAGHPQIWIRS